MNITIDSFSDSSTVEDFLAHAADSGVEIIGHRLLPFSDDGTSLPQYMIRWNGETWLLTPSSHAARERQAAAGRHLPLFCYTRTADTFTNRAYFRARVAADKGGAR
jgi:hypothetical protein